jgi:aspartate/glutamate racemase
LLGQNTIEKIPDEIGQLIHLEVLDLYDNAVNDISPKLKELPSLKTLDIQGVMYNHAFHAKLVNDFRHCKLYLDPPCSCMD